MAAGGDVGENRWVEAGRATVGARAGGGVWWGWKTVCAMGWHVGGAWTGSSCWDRGYTGAAGFGAGKGLVGRLGIGRLGGGNMAGAAWGRVGSWVAANGQGKTGPLALEGCGVRGVGTESGLRSGLLAASVTLSMAATCGLQNCGDAGYEAGRGCYLWTIWF